MSETPPVSPQPAVPPTTITWTAHEFEKKDRHPDWIWYAGLIFAIGAAFSFFYGNIFFGIFLVIAAVVLIMYALRDPKLLSISIGKKALVVNNESIPFEKVTAFWLDETGKPDKLLLRVKGSFIPLISLPLEGVTSETVRTSLKPHIPEEEMHESTSVKLFDRIGF